MRVLLFTGKGGVGKTTAAAATAAFAARRGRKTLVLSADGAHSLADAMGMAPSTLSAAGDHEPVEVEPGLCVHQVDTRHRFEQSWGQVQDYLVDVLGAAGMDQVEAEELTVLPGADEVLALLELRDQARSGRFDLVVVDCAPTAETLRLLALPELLRWYLDRVVPIDRRLLRTLRPMIDTQWRSRGLPVPGEEVLGAVRRLSAQLADVRDLLTAPGASVRLVLTPEAVVVAEARRTLTSLALYGYRVDGVVANRVFPSASTDPWLAGWAAAQSRHLDDVIDSFAPLPVHVAPYAEQEPVGLDALLALAAQVYGDADPAEGTSRAEPLTVASCGEEFVLSLALPHADPRDLDLARSGDDELVVTLGPHRRLLSLPSALRRCRIVGAVLGDETLRIRFAPDPALWRTR